MTDYNDLNAQLSALVDGIPYPIANLSNAAALIWHALPELNWAGFYLREGDKLILGPFQGNTACIVIPMGRGVCGTAAAQDETQVVPDVNAFRGHIACDSASNAEIVIPIHKNGKLVGVLDLDSPLKNRFTEEDEAGLKKIVAALEEIAEFTD